MTFLQPRLTFASFKSLWICTSPSLHLTTFKSPSQVIYFKQNATLTFIIKDCLMACYAGKFLTYRISSNFSSGQDSKKQHQIGSKLVSYLKLTNNQKIMTKKQKLHAAIFFGGSANGRLQFEGCSAAVLLLEGTTSTKKVGNPALAVRFSYCTILTSFGNRALKQRLLSEGNGMARDHLQGSGKKATPPSPTTLPNQLQTDFLIVCVRACT